MLSVISDLPPIPATEAANNGATSDGKRGLTPQLTSGGTVTSADLCSISPTPRKVSVRPSSTISRFVERLTYSIKAIGAGSKATLVSVILFLYARLAISAWQVTPTLGMFRSVAEQSKLTDLLGSAHVISSRSPLSLIDKPNASISSKCLSTLRVVKPHPAVPLNRTVASRSASGVTKQTLLLVLDKFDRSTTSATMFVVIL